LRAGEKPFVICTYIQLQSANYMSYLFLEHIVRYFYVVKYLIYRADVTRGITSRRIASHRIASHRIARPIRWP